MSSTCVKKKVIKRRTNPVREQGLNALKSIECLKKRASHLEKMVWNCYSHQQVDFSKNKDVYFELIYQVIGDSLKCKSNEDIQDGLLKMKSLWDNDIFTPVRNRVAEQDDFVMAPFEIEEGVIECRCGSKRVFSFTKQDRSCDEPTTVFAQCLSCNKKWKAN
jgi:DNA-directed RNA polymerase subunit M/transcription elongation factor TFIIS